MLLPVFILALLIWIFLAKYVARLLPQVYKKRFWYFFTIGTFLLCAVDQVAGMVYAHIWVMRASSNHHLVLKTNSVAEQVLDYGMCDDVTKPVSCKVESFFAPVAYGFGKLEVIMPSLEGDNKEQLLNNIDDIDSDKAAKKYEVSVSEDANDLTCTLFNKLPKKLENLRPGELQNNIDDQRTSQERLLKLASENITNGDKIRCISVRPISHITSRYLYQDMNLYHYGAWLNEQLYEYQYSKITDLTSKKILCEDRNIEFRGGWIARYVLPVNEYLPPYRVGTKGFCQAVSLLKINDPLRI